MFRLFRLFRLKTHTRRNGSPILAAGRNRQAAEKVSAAARSRNPMIPSLANALIDFRDATPGTLVFEHDVQTPSATTATPEDSATAQSWSGTVSVY